MAEIKLENLYFEYPSGDKKTAGTKALKGVNLTVRDHEFLVLLGPSGCGKSTTLRLIAGLEKPTEGSVYFDGVDVSTVEPMKRNVSMVFQTFALYPHLNVYKNMAFPLASMKLPVEEIKRRVEKTAKILDIEHILNRRPRALSGGQRQRVALGRAMVREPVVFLLDEPLSNLDAKMRQELRDEIVRLHKELTTTFVYVTHDQSEAMQMGTRLVVMNEGVILQVGTPQEVYADPNCVFVAGFVGSPKMNFFATRLNRTENGWTVKVMGTEVPIPEKRLPLGQEGLSQGQKVIVGIRPEDFRAETEETMTGIPFEATAVHIVPMGAGLHVQAQCGEHKFLSVLQNCEHVTDGCIVKLRLDPARVHVFDGETQKALCIPQNGGLEA
ncbi:MAG: ABC transporter ATP-binding protein [Clostridia bacterium]|nr:ABC transporter ATP-binding protein [Clostridia bacterium]